MQAAGAKSQRAASNDFDGMKQDVKELHIRRSGSYRWVHSSIIVHETFLPDIWCCAPKLNAGDV